jgi:uncharacterized protein involved in response to NO
MATPENIERAAMPPAILALAFRPFFLAGSLWAAISIALWIAVFTGQMPLLPSRFDPLTWHIHEMLFGWLSAAIAGFLLTAIPNWTGRPPVQGMILGALVVLWLLGRGVGLCSQWVPLWLAASIDVAFPLALCIVVWREIIAARNRRNLVMPVPVAVLATVDLAMYLQLAGLPVPDGLGWRLAIAAVGILVSVIGARIIPAFTRNWLVAHGATRLPASASYLDRAAVATLHAGLLGWAVLPGVRAVGVVLALAAALNLWRLVGWRGTATVREPLLAILHIGWLWLVVGAGLLGLSRITAAVPEVAALHALTAGAMGTMVLGVMTRVSLGHTGRPPHADRMTTLIYVVGNAAALCRIAAACPVPGQPLLLDLSALLWSAAFLLFVLRYGPMLWRARVS